MNVNQTDNTLNQKYGTDEIAKHADPNNWETWDAPCVEEVVYQKFPEFTCLCPRSGYPDFAIVHIITVPSKTVVELKSLKLWLNSFRNIGISHENATHKIAGMLFETLHLKYIFVFMEYLPRGNLITWPMVTLIDEGFSEPYEATRIKQEIISTLMQKA